MSLVVDARKSQRYQLPEHAAPRRLVDAMPEFRTVRVVSDGVPWWAVGDSVTHDMRDLKALLAEHGEDIETVAWAEGVLAVYEQATAARPAVEEGPTPQAARAREARARRCEALILLLCPAEPDATLPYATLAKRLRTHLPELFTFIRDPQVDATNNAAERSLRPLVTIRKISGGTRSQTGSSTCMVLSSLAATARIQGKNPTAVYRDLLLAPPGTPSPLIVSPTEDRAPLPHSHVS